MRTWRVEEKRPAVWRLVSGRGADRIRLELGRIDEREARRCLQAMHDAEKAGQALRVMALAKSQPEAAVRFLLGDAATAELLGVDFAKLLLADYQPEHYAPWRQAAKPASWRGEATSWARLLKDRPEGLGDVRLGELDPRVVFRWLRDLRVLPRGGAKPSASTLRVAPSGAYQRLLRAALQALLTHAYTEGHLETHVRLGELRIAGSTRRSTPAVDPLSLDEVLALLAASTGQHRAMWAVGAGEGLRPSELLRMEWSDVLWSSRTLKVRGTKTDMASAEVPLTPLAFDELEAWWAACSRPTGGLVFAGPAGEPYASGYKTALANAARRAGIARSVTPYLLRHSFATIAWSCGVDQDVARRVMRHADTSMLDRIYQRPRPADLVARLAAFKGPGAAT